MKKKGRMDEWTDGRMQKVAARSASTRPPVVHSSDESMR